MEAASEFWIQLDQMDYTKLPLMQSEGWWFPITWLSIYLIVVVWLLPKVMDDRKAFELRWALAAWNLFLTILSFAFVVCLGSIIFSVWMEDGNFGIICDPRARLYHGASTWMVFFFTMSKFLELGDTIFLALRKRPIIFLHWYHHVSVSLFCWYTSLMVCSTALLFSFVNSMIHTFMYWYYFLAALNIKASWGRWLTAAQTAQMGFGVFVTFTWASLRYLYGPQCISQNPYTTTATAFLIYASYFYLFYRYYKQKSH